MRSGPLLLDFVTDHKNPLTLRAPRWSLISSIIMTKSRLLSPAFCSTALWPYTDWPLLATGLSMQNAWPLSWRPVQIVLRGTYVSSTRVI